MKRIIQSVLLVAVTAVMVAQAQAQIVTYSYTGTRTDNTPETYFGTTITGTITINLSAAPSTPVEQSGYAAEWRNVPNIKITAQATNFSGGTGSTSLVDDTVVQQSKPLPMPGFPLVAQWNWLGFNQPDASDVQSIQMNFQTADDTLSLNKIFDPSSYFCFIMLFDAVRAEQFSIDSFTLVSVTATNILIGGVDTGIADTTYQGQSVSATIAGYASTAKNHGDFVSKVTQLANALKKAGLITEAQKSTLTSTAAQSSVGKKK